MKFTPFVASIAALQILPAAAETSASNVNNSKALEEIIVTATFDEASILQTPTSVSVIDADHMQARSAQHLENLLLSAPNITAATGASRSRFIQIRGVGDLEQFSDPKHQASVGLTIDDIDLNGLSGGATLFDVQQVEILRGPQGTRFGNAGLAGMLNIVSNAPTDSFEGEISATVGKYDTYSTGLVLSGPLSNTLNGRIAVQRQKSDGYIDNVTLDRDDTNNIDEQTFRAKLQWQPSEQHQFDWTVLHLDKDNGYDVFNFDNNRTTRSDEPGYDTQDTWASSLKHRFSFNNGYLLETIASLTDSELGYGFDGDWEDGLNAGWSGREDYHREQDSMALELRLHANRTVSKQHDSDWTLGIYYKQRDEDLESIAYGTPLNSRYEDDNQALFGQYKLALRDDLHLTIGLRVEQFGYDYNDSNNTPLDADDDLWGGDLTLEYIASDSTMVYAALARGYKSGGVNTTATTKLGGPFNSVSKRDFTSQRATFKKESLLNMELGIKGRYLKDRLTLQAALFRMERNNPQLESWVYDFNPSDPNDWDIAGWVNTLDNADEGTNQGVEIEAHYQFNNHFALRTSLGYMDTEIDGLTIYDMDTDTLVDISGRDQAKAPHYQYSVTGEFTFTDNLRGHLIAEGSDGYYTGFHHEGKVDSYQLVHASLLFEVANVELQAWARNLLDEEYASHGLYIYGHYTQQGEPRTYGINARYRF
jgi:iron complex outermembrane recepter protein